MHRKWCKYFFITSISFILLCGLIVYSVDPYQHYRQSKYFVDYDLKQRYLVPGFVRNYDYDTIIIGTSMTENFKPSEIKDKLNWNTIKLSMKGSFSNEQSTIMELALRKNKAKNIIYDFHFLSFDYNDITKRNIYGWYLYDDNKLNDLKYLINFANIKTSLSIFLKSFNKNKQLPLNRDKIFYWADTAVFGEKITLASYKLNEIVSNNYSDNMYKRMVNNFNNDLLSLIKKYPETNFYILQSPYSILNWDMINKQNNLDAYLKFKQYAAEELLKYPNVEFYDFHNVRNITFDLNNYKDRVHYGPWINSYMVDSIKTQKHKVTQNNYLEKIKDLKKQILEYEI